MSERSCAVENPSYLNPDNNGNRREEVETLLAQEGLDPDLRFVLQNLRNRIPTEKPQTQEDGERLYTPKFALLVISGKGSVGNTSTADYAAKLYGIPQENVFHAGEVFREYDDKMKPDHPEHDSVAFIERPEQLDKIVDEAVLTKLMEASIESPMIVEAKLGGALLRYLEQQARSLGIDLPAPRAAILKWADSKKRMEIAKKKKGSTGLEAAEIRKQSSDRDARDKERFNTVHPWLQGFSNILEKNARDNEGNPIYQDFVDASDHDGPEEDFVDLNEKLLRLGLVIERERELRADVPFYIEDTRIDLLDDRRGTDIN